MKKTNRRSFLKHGASGLGAAILFSQLPGSVFANKLPEWLDIPVGFQTFPIRDILAKDFPGTLKMMAGYGYKLVEMCSPQGYADIGFGPLTKLKPSEIKTIINDAGLNCPSCHFGFPELT
ncbi:MAG TPA: twin-arginine translocation signal domain-containing protein, partial [Puia sp.]|nr:twin-arginine translocation signal domain-containing protein [Puia sp.]